MNTYITQIIRVGVVLGIVLFAFAGEVFAAPTLAGPTEAVQTTETTAILVGFVENTYKTSLVWFEWSDNSSMYSFTTIGLTRVFDRGFFKASLSGLNPGATYYYRAVTSEGGTTVYSPTISFRTKGGTTASVTQTISYQNTTTANSLATAPVTTPVKKSTTSTVVAKKTTSVAKTATSTQGLVRENSNIAAVIGAGGILPGTLIGWIALLIALLVVILLFLKIYETSEKRKKARKPKKPQEGEEEEANDVDKILEKNR